MLRAILFTWMQGAKFYSDLHELAVDSIPTGKRKTWIDIGCGPGLVSRRAASNNFSVIGIDTDASMIAAARRIAKRQASTAKFEIGELSSLIDR
jgi:2-polyprenyl-3-methyl-5-hydroxy-6-metoxy-1,4-benzoquinol methylase